MKNFLSKSMHIISAVVFFSCSSMDQKPQKSYVEKFQNSFKSNLPKLKECYLLQIPKEEEKESIVLFDFIIANDGKVKEPNAYAKSFVLGKSAKECMIDELKKMQFEKPMSEGGSTTIHQPVYFQN